MRLFDNAAAAEGAAKAGQYVIYRYNAATKQTTWAAASEAEREKLINGPQWLQWSTWTKKGEL